MAKDQWPPSGYKFEFDEHVQNKIDALKNAPLDKREDYIRKQNEYVPPVIPELGEPNPQLDFPITEGPMPEMSIEFGADEGVAPPPIIPFDDSGREEGIMRNMMPQQRRDEDHPLWDQYWNFLIDEGDSYDNIQGGPPTFEQYLGAWERINKLPRGLHYGERRITPHWMKG